MLLQKKQRKAIVIEKQGEKLSTEQKQFLECSWQNFQGKSDKKNMNISWKKIEEYQVRRISFESAILIKIKQLRQIKFPHLKCLVLRSCFLQSIEQLQNLRMPQLEYLDLTQNFICNFKSLIKCNFPKLDYLKIRQKYPQIMQHSWITQFNFPQLRTMQYLNSSINSLIILNSFAKSQSQFITYLFLQSYIGTNRKTNRKCLETIKRKLVCLKL